MSTRRTARVAAAIRQVVSTAILFEMRDPRVKNVTILHVEVPVDLRTAKVYVSVMGEKKEEVLCLQGLNSSRGWLQGKIANELDLRYTPVLTFIADQGIKKSVEVSRTLREMDAESELNDDEECDDVEDVADENESEDQDLQDETGEEESPTD